MWSTATSYGLCQVVAYQTSVAHVILNTFLSCSLMNDTEPDAITCWKCCSLAQRRFVVLQDAPPLTRNMPPVAGSIKWSRSLFARVKQTMQRLQDVEAELLQGETGQEVTCAAGDNCWQMIEYTPLQTGHSCLLYRPCVVDLTIHQCSLCHAMLKLSQLS